MDVRTATMPRASSRRSRPGAARRGVVLVSVALASATAAPIMAHAADPSPAPKSAPVVDALIGGKRTTVAQPELAGRAQIAPDKDFGVVEIGRDVTSSHHLAAIRTAEKPHRHDRHAMLVLMLRGHGRMRLGDEQREVAEGSLLYVPPGAVHAFTNESGAPAVAYVIYTPPYDGMDWIGLDPAASLTPGP